MQKKYFEEEDEEFVEMNISPKLLEIVPVLFKTEPEVTVFYDGFIEKVESNKHLRKNEDNREIMDKALLDELLKYYTIDEINDALEGKTKDTDTDIDKDEEAHIDEVIRKTFKDKMEFRMFVSLVTQYIMEYDESPISAAAKSMQQLGKSDNDILAITSIINDIL